jgi:hypothetical protein
MNIGNFNNKKKEEKFLGINENFRGITYGTKN